MIITEQDLGRPVNLPVKPDWGSGIILKVDNGFAQIQFKDCPDQGLKKYRAVENPRILSAVQTDGQLNFGDLIAPEKKKKPRGPRPQLDFDQALERFQDLFPGRFADPAYLGDHKTCTRLLLIGASRRFGETLGERALGLMLADWDIKVVAGKMAEFNSSLRQLSQNLPGVFQALLKEPEQAFSYFVAFAGVLRDPTVSFDSMSPYFDKVKTCTVEGIGSWNAATALLFLAQPRKHLFVRPNMIKRFTETLGPRLHGATVPNWEAYQALTQAAGEYLEKLRPLGASDMIDVYLFDRLAHQDVVEKAAV